jgi:pimeloyl-ACP methyl ester carboxylesterase
MSRTVLEQVVREGSTLSKLMDGEPMGGNDLQAARPLILLIHGFTAHGERLKRLGSYLSEWFAKERSLPSALVVVYNYNSFSGIDSAAKTLRAKLLSYCPLTKDGASDISVLRNNVVIVAHSMGGLVARHFAAMQPDFVRALVMLGTPNDGVTTDRLLDLLVTVAESVTDSPLPNLRLRSSRSRKQLTKRDGPPHLIDELHKRWANLPTRPRTLTVSGAKPLLRLSDNHVFDALINRKIQSLMQGATNDGLVPELSVDMNLTVFTRSAPEYLHMNDYPEYSDTNHSHLVDNEYLARVVYNWILADERDTVSLSAA